MAKGKYLLGPNSYESDKMLIDGGVWAVHKVLEAYLDEVGWLAEPTLKAPSLTEGTTSMDIGPMWGHSCLVWYMFLYNTLQIVYVLVQLLFRSSTFGSVDLPQMVPAMALDL